MLSLVTGKLSCMLGTSWVCESIDRDFYEIWTQFMYFCIQIEIRCKCKVHTRFWRISIKKKCKISHCFYIDCMLKYFRCTGLKKNIKIYSSYFFLLFKKVAIIKLYLYLYWTMLIYNILHISYKTLVYNFLVHICLICNIYNFPSTFCLEGKISESNPKLLS